MPSASDASPQAVIAKAEGDASVWKTKPAGSDEKDKEGRTVSLHPAAMSSRPIALSSHAPIMSACVSIVRHWTRSMLFDMCWLPRRFP